MKETFKLCKWHMFLDDERYLLQSGKVHYSCLDSGVIYIYTHHQVFCQSAWCSMVVRCKTCEQRGGALSPFAKNKTKHAVV